MTLLVAGLVIFLGVHLLRVVAPDVRERFIARHGLNPWKGIYSLASLIGLALIIWGYGRVENTAFLYAPPEGARAAAMVMVPLALWLVIAGNFPAGYVKRAVVHPMLVGTLLWATAHLANNGDLASVLLFGGFLVWACVTLVSSIRRPRINPHAAAAGDGTALWPDAVSLVLALVLTWALVAFLHEAAFGVAVV